MVKTSPSNEEDMESISTIGKIPHALQPKKKKHTRRTSLVVQQLRICLPVQGIQVQVLVWEDSTAAEQLSQWVTTTEARMPGASASQQEKPPQREERTPQLESSHPKPQRRPDAAKNK